MRSKPLRHTLSLEASSARGTDLGTALAQAAQAARDGLEATKGMVAQHGKAACFQEKTVGLQGSPRFQCNK